MRRNKEIPRILMVDDDPDFQEIVRCWVFPRYDYVGLPNGDDILEELAAVEPALVILDVRMPGPDGFTLCRLIRADQRFARLPILFLTGCKEDEDFVKNLDAGGTAYLTKPITRKQLLSVIGELVSAQSGVWAC